MREVGFQTVMNVVDEVNSAMAHLICDTSNGAIDRLVVTIPS